MNMLLRLVNCLSLRQAIASTSTNHTIKQTTNCNHPNQPLKSLKKWFVKDITKYIQSSHS